MCYRRIVTLVSLLALMCLAAGQVVSADGPLPAKAAAFAQCDWTVRGRLVLDPQLPEVSARFGRTALKGVLVKVYESHRGVFGGATGWDKIGEVRTTATGDFAVGTQLNCADRRFRADVRFESDDLKILYEFSTSDLVTNTKDYTVYEDETLTHQAGTTTLHDDDGGDLVFRATGGEQLRDFEPRAHAEIWFLYTHVRETLASLGVPFTDRIRVKYPHNSTVVDDSVERSYANPINHVIYIHKGAVNDDFDTNTLIHELMHIWAYQHWTGNTGLVAELLESHSTHGLVDEPSVAFHEGFAQYAADKLQEIILGTTPPLPFNRRLLAQDLGLNNQTVERHDDAWISALHMLSTPNLFGFSFLTANDPSTQTYIVATAFDPPCRNAAVSFGQVLQSMLTHPTQGYVDFWTKVTINLTAFFQRVADTTTAVRDSDVTMYRQLMNPQGAVQPQVNLCATPFSLSVFPNNPAVVVGGSVNVAVNISRDPGFNFTSPVNLQVVSLPSGISATFAPNSAPGATSVLTLNVANIVQPGAYPLTVRGTAGTKVATTTLTLTVKRFFTLSLSEPDVILGAGNGGVSVTVTIARAPGFTDPINLTLEGIPANAGVGVSFNPASTSGSSSTLTVGAGRFAPSGNYQLTVRGTDTVTGASETASLGVEVIGTNLP